MLTPERARGQQHDKYLENVTFYRRIRKKMGFFFFFLWKEGLGERGQGIFKHMKDFNKEE